MKKQMLVLSLLVTSALALAATQAPAQSRNCAQHEQVVQRLAETYGESRQVIGVASNGTVMEVYADPDAGGWSIVITQPGGPSCLVASGQNYQHVSEPLPNTDNPA